jgi:hypothetical protein
MCRSLFAKDDRQNKQERQQRGLSETSVNELKKQAGADIKSCASKARLLLSYIYSIYVCVCVCVFLYPQYQGRNLQDDEGRCVKEDEKNPDAI